MKHVKLFEAFSTPKPLTKRQINWLDKCAKGGWSLNPLTGLVDVDVDFYCAGQGLKDFKGVAFGHVDGGFGCDNNQLTSLDGAPKTVKGNFICRSNQITSLEGAPQTVGGSFYCGSNQLTSLEGAPQTVGGYFYCANNQLTSLEGAPKTVKGNFNCASNPVSERTLASIFKIMKNGKSYQQALLEFWPEMDNDDRTLMYKDGYQQALEEFWPKLGHEERALMYKDHRSLTPEEIRRYQALATVNRIKNYL